MRNPEEHPAPPPGDYVERVNRAIDFVVCHLDQDLRLEDVASAACFSPFHFHRVFKSLIGETLAQFVKRLRLERALAIMSHAPDRPLTAVALECGFASSSEFSRSFKQRYGVPPSAFDVRTWRDSKRDDLLTLMSEAGPCHLDRLPRGENPDGFRARVRPLPRRTMAYIRVHDPYRSDAVPNAAARLVSWALARGLADGRWYGYMWDDPEVAALEDCWYDVGLEVPGAEPGGEVGVMEFPPMLVAEVEMRGDIALEMRLLDWLYGTWLPSSGYSPAHHPCFEAWLGRPFEHGLEHFELRAQLPVVRS